MNRYAATSLVVALSPGHSDITRFRPSFGSRRKKTTDVARTIGTVDVFYLRSGISGPTSRRASTCPNLRE